MLETVTLVPHYVLSEISVKHGIPQSSLPVECGFSLGINDSACKVYKDYTGVIEIVTSCFSNRSLIGFRCLHFCAQQFLFQESSMGEMRIKIESDSHLFLC